MRFFLILALLAMAAPCYAQGRRARYEPPAVCSRYVPPPVEAAITVPDQTKEVFSERVYLPVQAIRQDPMYFYSSPTYSYSIPSGGQCVGGQCGVPTSTRFFRR